MSAFKSQVPCALISRPNWILWKWVNRDGRETKLPINAKTLRAASTADPATWSSFDIAVNAMIENFPMQIGFCFRTDDNLFGVDLDSCYQEEEGYFYDWALRILDAFDTYAEMSPSGTGVKLFGIGRHQARGCSMPMGPAIAGQKRQAVEVYGWGRYFAFTGQKLSGFPSQLHECQGALDGLVAKINDAKHPVVSAPRPYVNFGNADALMLRGKRYLEKSGPAVSEQCGGKKTFRTACALVQDIGLSPDQAFELMSEWNLRCLPPWTDAELWHKINDAAKGRGRNR